MPISNPIAIAGIGSIDLSPLEDRLSALEAQARLPWLIKTANYAAQPGDRIVANGAAGGFTVTLPTTASPGDEVHILTLGTNAIAVDPDGANLNGAIAPYILQSDRQETHFIYIGAAGWVASVGGGAASSPTPTSSYIVEAQLVIDAILATGSALSDGQKKACNDRITAFKNDGVWSKLIAYYGFFGISAASDAINWRNPGAYNISWSGSVSHTSNGVQGDGSTGYGDTGIPIALLNASNTHLSGYIRSGKIAIGRGTGAGGQAVYMQAYDASALFYRSAFSNDAASNNASGVAETGLITGVSLGGSLYKYRNGVDIPGGNASNSPQNQQFTDSATLYLGAVNLSYVPGAGVHTNAQFASASIGYGLTAEEIADNYTSEQAYQTTLGRQV